MLARGHDAHEQHARRHARHQANKARAQCHFGRGVCVRCRHFVDGHPHRAQYKGRASRIYTGRGQRALHLWGEARSNLRLTKLSSSECLLFGTFLIWSRFGDKECSQLRYPGTPSRCADLLFTQLISPTNCTLRRSAWRAFCCLLPSLSTNCGSPKSPKQSGYSGLLSA